MQQIVIALVAQLLRSMSQRGLQGVVVPQAVFDQIQHVPGACEFLLWSLRTEAVEHHGVANHVRCLPARVGVVADIGDAFACEVRPADAQDVVAHVGRHPTEYAVANDVVELAEIGGDVGQAHSAQLEVTRAGHFGNMLAGFDLLRRQVDTDHSSVGVG
ncbi:hypothetical protein D3C85_1248570 [compost metagenome]